MAECSLLPAWPCPVLRILLIGSLVPSSSQLREFTRSIIGALAAHCGRMTGNSEVIQPVWPSRKSKTHSAGDGFGDALIRHRGRQARSEEHTSELQSHLNLVCRL